MTDFTKIHVTREQLVNFEACPEGLEAFDETFPSGVAQVETREELIKLIQGPIGRWIGWACCEDLLEIDLRGADLGGANLGGAIGLLERKTTK